MLTDAECRNLQSKAKPYKVTDSEGLYLEVRPQGSKWWRLKYYYHGIEKRLSLGVYPKTSLLEARKQQAECKDLIDMGVDPSLKRKEDKILAKYKNGQTFEIVAREWHASIKDQVSERYWNTLLHRAELDLFPDLGRFPIHEITVPMLYACLQKIEKRKAYEMARRALTTASNVFKYGSRTGRNVTDITTDLRGSLTKYPKTHHACIEVFELPKLVRDIRDHKHRLYRQTYLAMKFMLLTFVRTHELVTAERAHIDREHNIWTIPGDKMKMRNEHLVPLSPHALAIIDELEEICPNSIYLFPSIPRPRKHMSHGTILNALDKIGYKEKMTGHGFRALASSTLTEELGFDENIVDLQLAHKYKSKTKQAYFRAKFIKQRTKMMHAWSKHIEKLSK